jgi:1,2-diacylglycerol 3-beta-glucosyltransferase
MLAITTFFLALATLTTMYYVVFTVLGRSRAPQLRPTRRHRFDILIPAHNEELGIASVVRSIHASDYPPEFVRILVIADNCEDRTADHARAAGAIVHERTNPTLRGKGYALEFGLQHTTGDAVVILDADCELPTNALAVFDSHLQTNTDVIQAAVVVKCPQSSASLTAAVGYRIENAVAAGRDLLGWHNPLRGSGMCFHRRVFERVPWTCYGLTEDAEYSERLDDAGIRIRFEPGVVVRSEAPLRTADLCQQRRRWRHSLFSLKKLALNWLHSKPIVLGVLVVAGVLALVTRNTGAIAVAAYLVAMTACVYGRAVVQVRPSRRQLLALVGAPFVVARLLVVAVGGFVTREQSWLRTRRNAELVTPSGATPVS